MRDLASWAKRWNDASLKQLAAIREPKPRRWPLVGMFAIGLAAGVIGAYAVTQRSQIKRLASNALTGRNETSNEFETLDLEERAPVRAQRVNHRRKAALEVT